MRYPFVRNGGPLCYFRDTCASHHLASIRSALDGYKRKLVEVDDEIESIQFHLTKAAPLGNESEMFLDLQPQVQIAVEERTNFVMAKRLLQSRLLDLAVLAAEIETAAAARVLMQSPDKGAAEPGREERAANPFLKKVASLEACNPSKGKRWRA